MLFSWILRGSALYGLFIGLASVAIFVMRAAGIPVSFITVTAVALTGALLILRKTPTLPRERMTWARVILILFILFNCTLVGLEAVSSGVKSVDGFHIWAAKGYAIYRTIDRPFGEMAAAASGTIGSDYPLLVPLSEVWISLGLGRWDDLWVKVIFPLFTFSFLLIFYCCLRQFMNDPAAMFFTFLVSTVSFVNRLSTHNGADVPLMYYYVSSFMFMYVWFRRREAFWLTMSGIFMVLGMWTKFEGIASAGINLLVFMVFCAVNRNVRTEERGAILRFLALMTLGSLFILCFRLLLDKPYANNIIMNRATLTSLFGNLGRLKPVLYSFQKEIFGAPNKWNLTGYLFTAALALNLRKCVSRPYVYMLLAIALNFALYALIYVTTNFDLMYHIQSTWTRMYLHFMPLLIFFSAVVLVPEKESAT